MSQLTDSTMVNSRVLSTRYCVIDSWIAAGPQKAAEPAPAVTKELGDHPSRSQKRYMGQILAQSRRKLG